MEIARMNIGKWKKIRAFFDLLTADGFTIKGFKMVEGVNGLFVGFPSEKDKNGEYQDTVWAEKELKDQVREVAKEKYAKLSDNYTEPEYQEAVQQTEINDEDIPF